MKKKKFKENLIKKKKGKKETRKKNKNQVAKLPILFSVYSWLIDGPTAFEIFSKTYAHFNP
jgi:hypothetical protein